MWVWNFEKDRALADIKAVLALEPDNVEAQSMQESVSKLPDLKREVGSGTEQK